MIDYLLSFFLMIAIFTLSSCYTQTTADIENKEKKIRAARINSELGIAYLEKQDITRAKQKLMLAMSEDPYLPEVWYSMAYFLETTGNKEKAKEHYLKAIELAPKRGDTHNNYGTFLCRNGHYQEAIQHFLIAVKDPHYLDPASAYENAGLCALKLPDSVMAKNYFKHALLENPNRKTALLQLVELNYQQKKYADAKKSLDAFHKISSPTTESTALMDKVYAQL